MTIGRLTTLAAAMVVARRDFTAILFSRSFIFFLLGPLFPVLVGVMAGGVGQRVQESSGRLEFGIAMEAEAVHAMLDAREALAPRLAADLPDFVIVARLAPGETFDSHRALASDYRGLAAVVSGSPQAPRLTGSPGLIEHWQGPMSLLAAHATGAAPARYPDVVLAPFAQRKAPDRSARLLTAQAAQTLLFLLTMLLAGMVLSNFVEEKSNKIIEVLAAAIPMDAVFFGKLFAMLGVSLVGIGVWTLAGAVLALIVGQALPVLPAPAVGWPLFLLLGGAYFVMAYLLLGAVFLAIGSMAATVREVQTLSMPVTMLQLMVFFLASFAMTQPGSPIELAAVVVPFSSPFAMLARAALDAALWTHAAALAWQALCVTIIIRAGARMFRRRVMKSGSVAGQSSRRPRLLARLMPARG